MIEYGRRTGRTKRMLVKALSSFLDPKIETVFILSHNQNYAKILKRDFEDLIFALTLEKQINFNNHWALTCMGTDIHFISRREDLDYKLKYTPGRYIVYADHFMAQMHGTLPVWEPYKMPEIPQLKKQTTFEKFCDKFWELIP